MLARIAIDGDYCFEEEVIDNKSETAAPTLMGVEAPATSQSAGFKVFPNPTSGQLTLELLEPALSGQVSIEIFSMMGERVFSATKPGARQYELDLSGHPGGIYFIRLSQGNEVETQRVIRY